MLCLYTCECGLIRAMDTTELQTVQVPIDQLIPAGYNPRILSAKQLESLQKSIDAFGFVEPVVANKRNNIIVGGHARVLAAKGLGYESVPVVWVDLDPAHEKTLNVALNKIGGEFDTDQLAELLNDLDLDLVELSGFDEDELLALQADPFDAPAEPDKPKGARKYSTDELREIAKSYYPDQLQTITGFLAVVDERA